MIRVHCILNFKKKKKKRLCSKESRFGTRAKNGPHSSNPNFGACEKRNLDSSSHATTAFSETRKPVSLRSYQNTKEFNYLTF